MKYNLQMSSVLIAYQGNVQTRFSESDAPSLSTKSQGMIGEELYQVRLSDPLSDLQMIYSITDLPAGPGGRLVLWLALIMASILLGGFYLMYRLGLSRLINNMLQLARMNRNEQAPELSVCNVQELVQEIQRSGSEC